MSNTKYNFVTGAEEVLKLYTLKAVGKKDFTKLGNELRRDIVCDLIADLLHYAERHKINIKMLMEEAQENFEFERE